MQEYAREYIERCLQPKDTMERYIVDYTNHCIEPEYGNLTYRKSAYEIARYEHQETVTIIEQHRRDLQEKLQRLDEFQYLVTKNSFPDKFPDYVRSLAQTKHWLLYEKMNDGCQYARGTSHRPLWTPDNTAVDYCRDHDTDGRSICESCRFFLDIIRKCEKDPSYHTLSCFPVDDLREILPVNEPL